MENPRRAFQRRKPLSDLTTQSNNRQNSHHDHAAFPNKQVRFQNFYKFLEFLGFFEDVLSW